MNRYVYRRFIVNIPRYSRGNVLKNYRLTIFYVLPDGFCIQIHHPGYILYRFTIHKVQVKDLPVTLIMYSIHDNFLHLKVSIIREG